MVEVTQLAIHRAFSIACWPLKIQDGNLRGCFGKGGMRARSEKKVWSREGCSENCG